MTKEEIIAKLANTKVYVGGRTEEVQRKLFELGIRWANNYDDTIIDAIFIYIEDGYMQWTRSLNSYNKSSNKEIYIEDIMSLTLDIEFKPFDKVLVRDDIDDKWDINLFSRMNNNCSGLPYKCLDVAYKYCIPYEGNEHLLGTNKSSN